MQYNAARKLELRFCYDYRSKDYSNGGNLNMTNREVIRQEWASWLQRNNLFDREIRVTTVIDYFRSERIRFIIRLEDMGASPDEIMARGISYNMVKKYYGNRKFCEYMLEVTRKGMEAYQ